MTAECSGASASFSEVKWVVVPGVSLFWRNGSVINGFWSREDNRIVLAEGALDDGAVVRHEMLHAIQHEGRHTRRDFVERCGGVVSCLSSCVEAAGDSPVPDALPVVAADSMVIDVAVDPLEPAVSAYDGRFTVTVSVKNPRSDSVRVVLPRLSSGPIETFRFELTNGTIGLTNATPLRGAGPMVFGPGETRLAVFDFRVGASFDGASRSLPPGTYEVRGGFGRGWSATRSFVLGQ